MKKAQAAMEFLMTYGWAILVVLIAIGALAYFGVLNPSRFLPDKCVFTAGVTCIDFVVTRHENINTFTFNLENHLGETVIIPVNGLSGTNLDTDVTSVTGPANEFIWPEGPIPINFGPNNLFRLPGHIFPFIDNNMGVGQRYRFRIDIKYRLSSGLEHTATGEITGRVESQP